MYRILVLLGLLACSLGVQAATVQSSAIPRPSGLEPEVRFWTRVYTEITTQQGYLHDASNLAVVYDTLSLPANLPREQQLRIIETEQRRYQAALRTLASGKHTGLSPLEARVKKAWPKGTGANRFHAAAADVRFQRGQADRFREGLVRSGQWKPHIQAVLARHGLPPELDVLPHVESSFNPRAYSKVAAAGMWQFMPATARQYMQVDNIVDQRLDPYAATEAAAELLKRNYQATGSWPLAITAYNVGAGGTLRAVKATGTSDIETIIRRYRGENFGFASRNFFPSFLAALDVDRNAGRYFGDIRPASPLVYDTVVTPDYVAAAALARSARVELEVLRQYNPSLLEPVWTGEKHIPRGFELRLPRDQQAVALRTAMAAVPANGRFSHQQPDQMHRIAGGESLSVIARRYNTSVATLMALNGLRDAHRIRAGQELRLPGRPAAGTAAMQVASASSRSTRQARSEGIDTYVIQPGDSLWQIARQFNLSHKDLAAWNDLGSKQMIRPGQVLRLAALEQGMQ